MPGIYWHFVDVMWIVVYTTVYILVINPLRSEREAFRFLLYVLGSRGGRDRVGADRPRAVIAPVVIDPGQLVLVLRRRGAVPARAATSCARAASACRRAQIVFWHLGIALWAIGFFSPIHSLGEELLSAHMAQHLLIADLAAPLLLAGVRNPVLMFYLPKPVLRTLARSGWPRRAFRWLRQPLVAIPVFVLVLYGWHFSFAFEAAVRNPLVHALQHMSFVGDRDASCGGRRSSPSAAGCPASCGRSPTSSARG